MQDEIKDILLKQIEQFFLEGDSPTLTSHTGKKKKKYYRQNGFKEFKDFQIFQLGLQDFSKNLQKMNSLTTIFKLFAKYFRIVISQKHFQGVASSSQT